MKIRNLFCFLILIFCGFVAGCDKEKVEKDITNVDYLNIKFELAENLYVGDTFNLFDFIDISTNLVDPKIQFASENSEMIEFTGTTFSCIKAGITNLYVRGELSNGRFVYARERVEVENRPVYYSNFTINKPTIYVDYRNRENITNKATFEGETTYPVVTEYSNNLVIYDYKTGKLEVNGVGECRVILKVPVSRDENRNIQYNTYFFDVVVNKYITESTLKGSAGGINLKVGETGEFLIDVSPKSHTVNAPTLQVNSDILTLDGYRYTANASGECLVTMNYESGIGVWITKEYRVKIYDEPNALNLDIYDGNEEVDGDLEVGKEYTLVVSADCNLGNFVNILVDLKDPVELGYITMSVPNCKDGKVRYTFVVNDAREVEFWVGYTKDTYSSTLTCTDTLLIKEIVLP